MRRSFERAGRDGRHPTLPIPSRSIVVTGRGPGVHCGRICGGWGETTVAIIQLALLIGMLFVIFLLNCWETGADA